MASAKCAGVQTDAIICSWRSFLRVSKRTSRVNPAVYQNAQPRRARIPRQKRCVDRHANRDSRSFSGRHLIISPHHSPIALRHLTRDRAWPGAPPFPSTVLARWPRAATLIALPPTTTVRSNVTRWTQTPAAAPHLKKKNFTVAIRRHGHWSVYGPPRPSGA